MSLDVLKKFKIVQGQQDGPLSPDTSDYAWEYVAA